MQHTILVTGGAGFVGSHLCESLVADGHKVLSLDNYFAGTTDNHVAGVTYRTGHTKDIATHIPEAVDVIYHLGEYSRVASSLSEPATVWDLNIVGSAAVFEFWRAQNHDKLCVLVYAGSSTRFAAERADGVLGKDRAPYNFAKYINTELVHNYGRWYELPYRVAYFYNVYGPRERAGFNNGSYGTVVETFRQCALAHTPCRIHGDGTQTRAFTHVYDTISALKIIAEKGASAEYAISAQEVYSLNELKDMFGLEAVYQEPTASTRSSIADDTSALRALGWQQQYTLKDYITTCLTHH